MAETASRPRYGRSLVGSGGGTSNACRPRLGEAKMEIEFRDKAAAFFAQESR